MNTRTLLSYLKPRLVPVVAFTGAVALSLLLVWGVRKLGLARQQVVVNPESMAAKVAARGYFEPPRRAGTKGRIAVGPPQSVLPSAHVAFERELAQRKAWALKSDATAQAFFSQIANCVSNPSLPAPSQTRCLFAAHEVYKVRRGTPMVDIEFERVNRSAHPGVREHVERYFAIQAKARK